MNLLKQKIIEKIRTYGPISFETFMEMALYYPGLGYYMKGSTEIGRRGDFYTSPHLHRIFGAMCGRQMEEMWGLMGYPDLFLVVEMGAGIGYLAKDMLEYLGRSAGKVRAAGGKKNIFDHLEYSIVERNPSVRLRQKELLRDFGDKVSWHSDLGELHPVVGCFLSNELLDALPIRVIEMEGELKEIYVAVSSPPARRGGAEEGADTVAFVELKMPCSCEVKDYLQEFSLVFPRGYKTEVNLRMRDWLSETNDKLSEGFIMTIDYGYPSWDYYSEDRSRGTLLCYHRHQINEDPFRNVGEQDMTAHVNFSALKKWGGEIGLKTIGFCPQGTYLVSLGIDEMITELYGESCDPFETAKIKGLILPQGLGESHKVMVHYKGKDEPKLRGFALRNQTGKL